MYPSYGKPPASLSANSLIDLIELALEQHAEKARTKYQIELPLAPARPRRLAKRRLEFVTQCNCITRGWVNRLCRHRRLLCDCVSE